MVMSLSCMCTKVFPHVRGVLCTHKRDRHTASIGGGVSAPDCNCLPFRVVGTHHTAVNSFFCPSYLPLVFWIGIRFAFCVSACNLQRYGLFEPHGMADG
jgi:hypothetical protein